MSHSKSAATSRKRELIIVLRSDLLKSEEREVLTALQSLNVIVEGHDGKIAPIIPSSILQHRLLLEQDQCLRELNCYRQVSAPDEKLELLREELRTHPAIETAYIKNPAVPANLGFVEFTQNKPSEVITTTTPDFTSRQAYLNEAPIGIDARFAWSIPGGKGTGIKIIDCESNWNFVHEDLGTNCKGVIIGTPVEKDDNHGTAMLGMIAALHNGFGVNGIAPEATIFGAVTDSDCLLCTSKLILEASCLLAPGDIILLELQRHGPCSPDTENSGRGFLPIEWWPDDFCAIAHATSKGIIVVEAAGNGYQNLDCMLYDIPLRDFPKYWSNPLASGGRNSGAIMVGAGDPPRGIHGRDHDERYQYGEIYSDRVRCIYSNFGTRVDCQGWGFEVTSLGIGDLQPGLPLPDGFDHNRLYTDLAAGTSSASAMIAGALACVQGAVSAAGKAFIKPTEMQLLLRSTGALQQNARGRPVTERIGTRPNLREILGKVLTAV